MKIRVLKPFLVARSNGGEISLIEFLQKFKNDWGWDVGFHVLMPEGSQTQVAQFLAEEGIQLQNNSYQMGDVPVQIEYAENVHPTELESQGPVEEAFLKYLETEKPDFVIAHYTDFFALSSAMKWSADRTWVMQTDNEFPRQKQLDQFPQLANEYKKIKKVMVASPFMHAQVAKDIPWVEKNFVLFNVIESLKTPPVKREPQHWVFVNPTPVKGLEFMLKLTASIPEENFLFVGNWDSRSPERLSSNVQFIPRQANLDKVFESAKGLLMPSEWEEAFGRIPLEAMAAGVPVITSDRGNLPHTVGNGGLCLPLDLDVWKEALQKPASAWDAQINEGFKRVKDYQSEMQQSFAQFKEMVEAS